MADPKKQWDIHPWHPIQNRRDLKTLGKLQEELGELTSAVARCIIQGIDERDPSSGKPNRQWLAEEIADVQCGLFLAIERFKLSSQKIGVRRARKIKRLRAWHRMA